MVDHGVWHDDDAGLSPVDVGMGVAIPEFDGRIIGPTFAFKEIVDDDGEAFVGAVQPALTRAQVDGFRVVDLKKELAAAWPAVAAGGAALFLSNKAGPLAAFMALAPLPWALARPEARMTEDAFVASKSTRRAAAVAVGAHAVGACWARYQASDVALSFSTVALQAAWALARRRALDDGASTKATGLLLCLGAGDACAALLA